MTPDEREGGYIKLWRRIESWPLWKSMTANQRMVWLSMLVLANWKDDCFWYGKHRIEVKRGQLAHSEKTIAQHAKVSRIVVRDTIEKLTSEGAIDRQKAPLKSQAPYIITIHNYDRYQSSPDSESPGKSQARAKREPSESQGRSLREEGKEGKEGEEQASPAKISSRSDHPCVLKLSATRDEAAGAAREGTDPDSSPELSGSEPSPSEAKALAGGPPTKAATTTDDLGPPPCPGPPEILAHEKLPLSSVESGQLDLPAAPPAEVEGEERRSPATSPPPEPKKKRRDADSPSGRLFAYWRDEIWPRVGEGTYLESKADFIQLAAALRELSEAEVRKVFERAVADPFWAGKPLKAICSTSALNSLRARPPPSPAKKLCSEPAESFEGAVGIEEMQIT